MRILGEGVRVESRALAAVGVREGVVPGERRHLPRGSEEGAPGISGHHEAGDSVGRPEVRAFQATVVKLHDCASGCIFRRRIISFFPDEQATLTRPVQRFAPGRVERHSRARTVRAGDASWQGRPCRRSPTRKREEPAPPSGPSQGPLPQVIDLQDLANVEAAHDLNPALHAGPAISA